MADCRLDPPFWKPDAYVLRRMARALRAFLQDWKAPPYRQDEARVRSEATNADPALWQGSTAVDLGCGDRPYSSLFVAKVDRYIACDLAPSVSADGASPASTSAPPPDLIIDETGRVDLPSACADLVLSFQVLEHVWDLDAYLGEARRLVKPDGQLLLSTHGTWLYHPHPTDFRRWTRTGLVREIESRGWAVQAVQACVGPLAWTTQFRALGMCQILGRLPLIGRVASAALGAVMHARMILEDRITPPRWIEDNASVYIVVARPKVTLDG